MCHFWDKTFQTNGRMDGRTEPNSKDTLVGAGVWLINHVILNLDVSQPKMHLPNKERKWTGQLL